MEPPFSRLALRAEVSRGASVRDDHMTAVDTQGPSIGHRYMRTFCGLVAASEDSEIVCGGAQAIWEVFRPHPVVVTESVSFFRLVLEGLPRNDVPPNNDHSQDR
jgi:hypothetical protein